MKAAFALFLVLMLIVAALQADAKPTNLQGRRLADASMDRKAIAGSSGSTVSSTSAVTATSSKTTDSTSSTSTSSTPTTATSTSNTDTKTKLQLEKNSPPDTSAPAIGDTPSSSWEKNSPISAPTIQDTPSSHHVIINRSDIKP